MEQGKTVLPMIRRDRCTACGDCVEACPAGALEMQEGWVVLARPEDCAYCGDCETICPQGAIALPFEIAFWEEGASRAKPCGGR